MRKARRTRIVPSVVLTATFTTAIPACVAAACNETVAPQDCTKEPPYCFDVAVAEFGNGDHYHAPDIGADTAADATLDVVMDAIDEDAETDGG